METTKTKKKSSGSARERITKAYKEHLLLQGVQPASVYKFCLDLGITEEEFYSHFGSFEGVEKGIWKQFVDETISRLQGDNSFAAFSAQEKVLAFYYTLLEILNANRSLAILQLGKSRKLEMTPPFLKDFQKSFEDFIGKIMMEGQKNGEIASRPYLDSKYPQLFWIHFGFLLNYWKDDNSSGFERTDAYVEKSVRLAFDLISKGALDSAIDFAKFIYQSKWKQQ